MLVLTGSVGHESQIKRDIGSLFYLKPIPFFIESKFLARPRLFEVRFQFILILPEESFSATRTKNPGEMLIDSNHSLNQVSFWDLTAYRHLFPQREYVAELLDYRHNSLSHIPLRKERKKLKVTSKCMV